MPILSYENEISFTCKLNSFSYEWLCTKTRFEKESKGNSEMAYSCLCERPFKLQKNGVFLFEISFFVLAILTFFYYAK